MSSDLNFADYQAMATETAVYPGRYGVNGLLYVSLGLGEVGEIQNQVKKILRDDDFVVTEERREAIEKELGDALWYFAMMCEELGFNMGQVAQKNLDKLNDRKERGVLRGSGDNR